MARDFYQVLQVTRGATPQQINSAYRRRASDLHPDAAGGREFFIELQDAYSALHDPAHRAAYDRATQFVTDRLKGGSPLPASSAEPFSKAEPVGSFREISLKQSFDNFTPSFDEIFNRLWSNFELLTRPKAERLQSLTLDVPLTRQEAIAGGSVRILVPARMTCPACHGRGSIELYECWRCRGQGSLTAEYPLDVAYPAGLLRGCVVRVPLDDFGIRNFYLTVRFRPTETE
jgi:DnaJ-class molecular chaperone